jgi:hypothetical protein
MLSSGILVTIFTFISTNGLSTQNDVASRSLGEYNDEERSHIFEHRKLWYRTCSTFAVTTMVTYVWVWTPSVDSPISHKPMQTFITTLPVDMPLLYRCELFPVHLNHCIVLFVRYVLGKLCINIYPHQHKILTASLSQNNHYYLMLNILLPSAERVFLLFKYTDQHFV